MSLRTNTDQIPTQPTYTHESTQGEESHLKPKGSLLWGLCRTTPTLIVYKTRCPPRISIEVQKSTKKKQSCLCAHRPSEEPSFRYCAHTTHILDGASDRSHSRDSGTRTILQIGSELVKCELHGAFSPWHGAWGRNRVFDIAHTTHTYWMVRPTDLTHAIQELEQFRQSDQNSSNASSMGLFPHAMG
jgi:hypothetical protein